MCIFDLVLSALCCVEFCCFSAQINYFQPLPLYYFVACSIIQSNDFYSVQLSRAIYYKKYYNGLIAQ